MPGPLSIIVPLVLAGVLVVSGIAKLRRPDDLASWTEIGVPAAFRREWLRRLHPWGELVLAASLAALGGTLGLLAALVSVLLMSGYLWLVWRAYRREPDASCACFGSRAPITRRTILRNAWLTLVALGSVSLIWMNPVWGGALAAVVPGDAGWIVGTAVAVMTAVLVLASEFPAGEAPAMPTSVPDGSVSRTGPEAELDYIRTRIPAVTVTLADGSLTNLRSLAMRKPILLLAVSHGCGSCAPVIARLPHWRELLPEMEIRLLLQFAPADSSWTETSEPQSLHDPDGYVRASIEDWATPSAVLLGADGMLAGGPVTGTAQIENFVSDIYEALHGVRPVALV